MGAAVVRAYGLDDTIHDRVTGAIGRRYDAEMRAHLRAATLWPMSSVFYALDARGRDRLQRDLRPGVGAHVRHRDRVPVPRRLFLSVFERPAGDLRRDPDRDRGMAEDPRGARPAGRDRGPAEGDACRRRRPRVAVRRHHVRLPHGRPSLRDVDVAIRAGAHVAIVGETGSGKTTFAKLLTRLADPLEGSIAVGGVDLREVAPASRRTAIRMVPQDGFLFDCDHPRERPRRPRRRHRPRRRGRVRRARARRLGRGRCRTASTRARASAASSSRSVSVSWSRSRAPRSPTPGC